MSRRFKIQYYSTAMLLAAVLFALFSIFPLTGDDWFRESLGPWLTDPQAALTLLTILPPALQKTCEDGQLSFADLA